MDGFAAAMRILPRRMRVSAERLSEGERDGVEEFRVRLGFVPTYLSASGERTLKGLGAATEQEIAEILALSTNSSPYASAGSLRRGFVSAPGGVRVGVCGEGVVRDGVISTLRHISSLSIRVPREYIGCAAGLISPGSASTLIVSPPGGGKTTLLRDAVRLLSEGGCRVAVCDERGEIAGLCEGRAGFALGGRADVIAGAPKGEAAMMLLRTMNPEWLAMDEITEERDAEACLLAANCGVKLIATAHASDEEELRRREVYDKLFRKRIFPRLLVIERCGSVRRYREAGVS